MAPPHRPRALRKDHVSSTFKSSKTLIFSDSNNRLAPNIRSISWSPAGSMLAQPTGANIRVWNAERPETRYSSELRDTSLASGGRHMGAHTSTVERVHFNPRTESTLASIGQDWMVKIWDVRLPGGAAVVHTPSRGPASTGGLVRSKAGESKLNEPGLFLTWHPDGTQLLAGTSQDHIFSLDVRKADLALGDVTATVNNAGTSSIKYDLDIEELTLPKDPSLAKYNYNQMAFSNSGNELFVTTSSGSVEIYTYPSLEKIYTLRAHSSSCYAVQQSPTGQHLALGGADGIITLWDTQSWLCTHALHQQPCTVRELSFSFDGSFLVGGAMQDGAKDGDRGLHIYHVDTGDSVYMIETTHTVRDVAWHPLRYALAYTGDNAGMKVVGNFGN